MNCRETHRLARAAGFQTWFATPGSTRSEHTKIVILFANMIEAHVLGATANAGDEHKKTVKETREACAKLCDQLALFAMGNKAPYKNCAAEIRAQNDL